MGVARYSPWDFVVYLYTLQATAGQIALTHYMSKTASNGGNDSTTELFKHLRSYREGGHEKAPTMNTVVGGRNVDLALKGQGSGETFIKIWDFMSRNMEQMKKLKVKVYKRREEADVMEFVAEDFIYRRYFSKNSEKEGFEWMIRDHFFGIDCIGFVGQFLVYTGEWPEYKGMAPKKWPNHYCKIAINSASEIRALDFLVWIASGHIAIVDEFFNIVDDKTVRVDICQSSRGGPQLNQFVYIKEVGQRKHADGTSDPMRYKFLHLGTPAMPVTDEFYIYRRDGFTY
jgi:hypothetical protein